MCIRDRSVAVYRSWGDHGAVRLVLPPKRGADLDGDPRSQMCIRDRRNAADLIIEKRLKRQWNYQVVLSLGKLRLGSVQLGNSIGVLVVSLLLGQQHFAINTDALNLGLDVYKRQAPGHLRGALSPILQRRSPSR